MVGVPIGTDEYVLGRALKVVRDVGAGRLACCLANMPDMQAAALIVIESLGQRQVTWKGLWTRGCPSKLAGGQTTGRSRRTRKSSSYRTRRRHSRMFGKGARIIGSHCNLTSKL